jgi:hypothetical protein
MTKLSSAERIVLAVNCTRCSKCTEKRLVWLMGKRKLSCGTPGCDGSIDLNAIENRILIEEAAKLAASTDTLLRKMNYRLTRPLADIATT